MKKLFGFFLICLSASSAAAFRVGLVLDKGGKDDKSFNTSAYEGAKKAEKELGILLKYVEAADTISLESMHRAFAKRDYDLIIGVGFAQMDAVKKVSKQYPQRQFAIIDGVVEAENVKSLLFEEHEGSYLVGAIAALKSKTGQIGFIGGMDIPLIRRFEMGFVAGVKKINSNAKVISNFIGIPGEAWNNPAKAKELALSQINNRVDVIFVAAGASGSGVFDAAEEKKIFAIGVDSNQNWMKPGVILTSMLKRVDVAVFDTIKEASQKQFKPGLMRYGLKSTGVDYSIDSYNQNVLDEATRKHADQIKSDIINQKISVPDFYKKK